MPRVSVLLPCYNAADHVGASVESLLGQTFGDFEIIAIDDGSSDATAAILARYAADDRRLNFIQNGRNLGLIPTLNRAIDLAHGEYIARMDADDEALPARLERQVAFLVAHPDVHVLSVSVVLIDAAGRTIGRARPWAALPAGCRFMTLFANPVAHSGVMMRGPTLATYRYSGDAAALHAEDYELWSRLVRAGCGIANLQEPLLRRRTLALGVSLTHEDVQVRNFVTCVSRHLREVMGDPIPANVASVLANRIDFQRGRPPLSEALALLRALTAQAVHESQGSPSAQQEIRHVARMQTANILLQCVLKGRGPLRVRALTRLLLSPSICLGRSRRALLEQLHAHSARQAEAS